MAIVKVDMSIRADVEVEAESYAVAEELINQFIAIESDDKRLDVSFGISQVDVHYMESDDIEDED
tara:strand:- start:436 stop:630 length:195 start_codon:yes stop_codon:yes gene_type:complete